MSQLKTAREIGRPFDDTSIEAALHSFHSEVISLEPTSPYWAIRMLNFAMWLFALQFAEDLDQVRYDVMVIWNSPGCFPSPREAETQEKGEVSWTN